MKKQTKTLKLKVVKPVNMDWDEFSSLINQKSFAAMRFANKLIQKKYIEAKDDYELAKEKNEYKEAKEELSSYVRDALNQEVQAKISGEVGKSLLRGDSTLPTFKNKNALHLRGQKSNNPDYSGFEFYQEDDDVFAELKIRPGRVKNRPKVLLATRNIQDDPKQEGYWKEIERVLDNEFRPSSCQVLRKHGDVFLSISYERPIEENILKEGRIMGVDIGVSTIYAAFNDSLKRKSFHRRTNNIIRRKSEIRKQRKKIRENVDLRDKRRGHGKESKFKPLTKMKEKWNNFRKTSNHQLSRAIVDYAVKKEASIIQMEDFSGSAKQKSQTFIGNDWPVKELQDQIRYKAEEQGIRVQEINPQYTSRRCPSCGYINMYFSFDYRKKNDFPDFKCRECDFRQKADYVGAKNIAESDIEKIIKEQLKKQKTKEEKEEKELVETLA